MLENTLQMVAALKWIYVGGFVWLYGSGGISGKWKRRYAGAIYLVAGVIGFSFWTQTFSWWYLSYLSVIGALCLPYGASSTGEKIRKRAIYGLALAASSAGIFAANGLWVALFFSGGIMPNGLNLFGSFKSHLKRKVRRKSDSRPVSDHAIDDLVKAAPLLVRQDKRRRLRLEVFRTPVKALKELGLSDEEITYLTSSGTYSASIDAYLGTMAVQQPQEETVQAAIDRAVNELKEI